MFLLYHIIWILLNSYMAKDSNTILFLTYHIDSFKWLMAKDSNETWWWCFILSKNQGTRLYSYMAKDPIATSYIVRSCWCNGSTPCHKIQMRFLCWYYRTGTRLYSFTSKDSNKFLSTTLPFCSIRRARRQRSFLRRNHHIWFLCIARRHNIHTRLCISLSFSCGFIWTATGKRFNMKFLC